MDRLEDLPHASHADATDQRLVAQHKFCRVSFTDSLPLVFGAPPAICQAIEQPIGRDRITGRRQFMASGLEVEIRKQSRPTQRIRQLFEDHAHEMYFTVQVAKSTSHAPI